MKKKILVFGFLGLLSVLLIGGGGYWFFVKGTVQKVEEKKEAAKEEKKEEESQKVDQDQEIALVSDPGVTWLSPPQKISDLGLYKKKNEISSVDYYKVATLESGGEIILAKLQYEGPGGPQVVRFKKNKQGIYYYLSKHSYAQDYQSVADDIEGLVQFDSNTVYRSLSSPSFLDVSKATLESSGDEYFDDLKDAVEVANSLYGKIYKSFMGEDSKETGSRVLSLKQVDSTIKHYKTKVNFLTDDGVAQVTWNDEKSNSASFTSEGYTACALTTNEHIITNLSQTDSRLKPIGKTKAGETIYTVASNDKVMSIAYENYKRGREQEENFLSLEKFAKSRPLFIWKNGLEEYVIFTNKEFGSLAECGKPVIYLYPDKETKVSVKLGVNITKSNPLYENGWDVLAYPTGKLVHKGKAYPYLFWEGQGQNYPKIDSGFVVKNTEVKQIMEKHLTELGLNVKEKEDFIEFWLPRMPKKPYIRFTWFGTSQVNKLAPLLVSPKPETVIRIFLDFEGLDRPVHLVPQKLSAPTRKGFTLIEWGGLLRGQ